MRLPLFDRVLEVGAGRIVGTKAFLANEDFLDAHFGRASVVPGTILLESMVQLLGWGIAHAHDFGLMPIVSLVEGLEVSDARLSPPFEARITGETMSTSRTDSLGRVRLEVAGARVAAAERVIYTHFPADDPGALRRAFESRVVPDAAAAWERRERP